MYIFCSNKIDFVFIPGIVAHKVHRVRTRVPRREQTNKHGWVKSLELNLEKKLIGHSRNNLYHYKLYLWIKSRENYVVTHSHAPLRYFRLFE